MAVRNLSDAHAHVVALMMKHEKVAMRIRSWRMGAHLKAGTRTVLFQCPASDKPVVKSTYTELVSTLDRLYESYSVVARRIDPDTVLHVLRITPHAGKDGTDEGTR